METRTCSNCGTGPMKSETGEIQKELRISLVKISVEEYLPGILKGYGQYTIYVCQQCGKLEVFLKEIMAEKKPKGKTQSKSQKGRNY